MVLFVYKFGVIIFYIIIGTCSNNYLHIKRLLTKNYEENMAEFSRVSDTLYLPLFGRSYTSIHFPEILYDKISLVLTRYLAREYSAISVNSEFKNLSTAIRSKNID
jgi:hypothetical protein